jgi:predicted deacylase
VLISGCAAHRAPPQDAPVVIQPKAPSVIGYSVQSRPITMHTFGAGDRPVLIMAAIHGDEQTSATVATAFINLLAQYPQTPANVPVVIIPIANPDGYGAGTRTNAHKIDLNRNFPATNFSTKSRSPKSSGGKSPLSEPESRALAETIDRLHPRLIISIHSMEDPTNNYDGPRSKSRSSCRAITTTHHPRTSVTPPPARWEATPESTNKSP